MTKEVVETKKAKMPLPKNAKVAIGIATGVAVVAVATTGVLLYQKYKKSSPEEVIEE